MPPAPPSSLPALTRAALVTLVTLVCPPAPAEPGPAGVWQDHEALRAAAAAHLESLATRAQPGLSARARIGPLDPRLRLAACPGPEFFLSAGDRAQGGGTLGARCGPPTAWTVYLTYQLELSDRVLVARRPLPAGQSLGEADLEPRLMELSRPPGRYFRDPRHLAGAVTLRPLAAGQAVTLDDLRREPVVRAGQRVRLVAGGAGFSVSQEGSARNSAYIGDTVRVKMPSGRILQGVAEADGTVRLP